MPAPRRRPTDFAYGAAIDADGSEALYEVVVPAALYEGVVRADLGDVRVFNGAGEVVPHAWRPRRATSTEAQPTLKLTLFPLRGQAGANIDALVDPRAAQCERRHQRGCQLQRRGCE